MIEKVASKLDERITELQGHLNEMDDRINCVQKGGMEIQTMQKSEINLTQQVKREILFTY